MHIKNPCKECQGKGTTTQRRSVTIPVPAGIEDGQTVRVPISKKEVFVTFRVSKSDYFRRDGPDVHTDKTISLSQAILGGSVKVESVYEHIPLEIPPGTSSHTRIRLPGKGIRRINSYGYGDHYVHIKIKIPTTLSRKQRALVKTYAELEGDTPGTTEGIVKTKSGKKVAIDTDKQVEAIKSALIEEEEEPQTEPVEEPTATRKTSGEKT
jgi:DnaJ family protein A protein 3